MAGDEARGAALGLLEGVFGDRRMLADLLADPRGPLAALAPPARARAQRLAVTTLRLAGRADRLLGPHLRKAPPAVVMVAMRLALVEVFALGTPAHAAVNAAVAHVRAQRRVTHLAGLANAVLRRAVETDPAAWAALSPAHLPRWLRQPLVHAWGREAVTELEAMIEAEPPLDLTPRDSAAAPGLAVALEGELLATGSIRRAAAGQISALPGYGTGAFWVQDAAAALPARLLAPRPGERVLDLCAAPGGKTLQLAAAGAEVTALDLSGPRLARLRENLARTGLAARIVTADALAWMPEGRFDAILLDAPCSASGTLRRHPDLPLVKDGSTLGELVALQAQLIDRALGWLEPGGRLMFCTCSLLPEEGEAQVAAARARHPGLAPLPLDAGWIEPAWRSAEGGLRIRPDHWAGRGGIDGFYMALLTLRG